MLDSMHVHNDVIFRVDNSSSVHVDNKKRYLRGPTQELNDTTIIGKA